MAELDSALQIHEMEFRFGLIDFNGCDELARERGLSLSGFTRNKQVRVVRKIANIAPRAVTANKKFVIAKSSYVFDGNFHWHRFIGKRHFNDSFLRHLFDFVNEHAHVGFKPFLSFGPFTDGKGSVGQSQFHGATRNWFEA